MNYKTFIYSLFFMIFAVSCNKQITEPEQVTDQPAALKAAVVGTTYYVAKTGSDNNAGSSASPFATMAKAAQIAKPGDVVIVKDGTYTTSSDYMNLISCKGTAENYITFKSENKWGAIFDGQSKSGYCVGLMNGASYLKFIDFEIKNFLAFGFDINHAGNISSYITVQGCKIRDIGRISDTGDYGRCGFYIGPRNHHITIDKNLMYNIGRTGPDNYWMVKDHAIYTATVNSSSDAGHHNVITNNIMYNCSGNALNIGSNDDLIANNVMAWTLENSKGGFCFIAAEGAGGQNLTIANNIFYQPPVSNPYAIISFGSYTGWSIKNNIVYGGSMFGSSSSATAATMKGGNYGKKDCENGEINPLVVSGVKSNVDFRLQSSSPAINKGVNVGLTSDFLGNSLVGLPDIGAYEYGGTTVTPAPAPVPPTTTTTYYNKAVSATATRNDCGTGYTGSTVTYTISASKYSSTISQADADAKATADLTANKQAYANANGTCTATSSGSKTYYSVAITMTGTKNDCGTGYTGSSVTGTLPAGSFTSTVSQADADKKATDYANANKQAYFNANGTCKATGTTTTKYYSAAITGSATKNNCGTGYKGSLVTVTMPVGYFTSTISQADADSKASTYFKNNIQSYANANGTCTRL